MSDDMCSSFSESEMLKTVCSLDREFAGPSFFRGVYRRY